MAREYHYEMPFEIEVDGPYFNIVDFFSRLSRLSRIINVGDLTFNGLGDGKTKLSGAPQHHGHRQLHRDTTFFTMPSERCTGSGRGSAYRRPRRVQSPVGQD